MAKGSGTTGGSRKREKRQISNNAYEKMSVKEPHRNSSNYLLCMSHSPKLDESSHWIQMIPTLFFTAMVIMITRMAAYQRPMEKFFWNGGSSDLNDFFSYYKMTAILICAIVVLVFLLYRIFIQAFYIKRSFAYIPMLIYISFVSLSYLFSDYKLFALWGWNDRFEGTLVLLSYMVILFYTINTVNSEKNVKLLIYVLAATSALLGFLGLSQALDHDFFRTPIGKKLITPSWFWDQIGKLDFTFQNKEIYQTVYNINYVSFYLTLLIPLFGLLFIRSVMLGKSEPLYKKTLWGVLFALLIYNLIGSASSGGLMGMAFAVLVAIIVLNKKILIWKKPVVILLMITVIISGTTLSRWLPELGGAIDSAVGTAATPSKHKIDYIITEGRNVILGYNGEEVIFKTFEDDPSAVEITDSKGSALTAVSSGEEHVFQIEDSRLNWISVKPAADDDGNQYVVITTDDQEWPFLINNRDVKYRNDLGNLVSLHKVPSVGWENNLGFGSGRGYIWSRTIPMLNETLILGHGADTYCLYFPHDDYVGKYNANWNINMVVDKPHNMYMGILVGTGGIAMLALLVLWGMYIVQSFLIFRRERYDNFLSYAGAGIFLGICGFLAAGLVNDSSVSTMPMFYGLLGAGIAINMILIRTGPAKAKKS